MRSQAVGDRPRFRPPHINLHPPLACRFGTSSKDIHAGLLEVFLESLMVIKRLKEFARKPQDTASPMALGRDSQAVWAAVRKLDSNPEIPVLCHERNLGLRTARCPLRCAARKGGEESAERDALVTRRCVGQSAPLPRSAYSRHSIRRIGWSRRDCPRQLSKRWVPYPLRLAPSDSGGARPQVTQPSSDAVVFQYPVTEITICCETDFLARSVAK